MSNRIAVIQGDISKLKVDAVVNPTDTKPSRGFGTYKFVHRAAGPKLIEECRQLPHYSYGEAQITSGYELPAKWVIHTAIPIWLGGKHQEPEQLTNCYLNSLALAAQHDIRTIAFPPLSIGLFRYPLKRGSKVAISAINNFLEQNTSIEQVIIICRGERYFRRFCFVVTDRGGDPSPSVPIEFVEREENSSLDAPSEQATSEATPVDGVPQT